MAGETMSQAAIDAYLQEVKEAEEAKKLGIAPKNPISKNEECRYICVYCKSTANVEYEKALQNQHVKIAPMIFVSGYRHNNCKNSCGHWYVSADYLKSLKRA